MHEPRVQLFHDCIGFSGGKDSKIAQVLLYLLTMKKIFVIICAAALTLAGCAQQEKKTEE